MQEKKIRLTSGELSYFAAGSGRPLLYLHPAGGVRRSKVLEGLAQSFSLHVPVIPGWEGTELHPGVSSRIALANLVAEFHAGVIGKSCDVMGWSFGGAVALWLALERPELVERLVLECPAGLLNIDKRIKRVNRKLLEHYTLILQGTNDGTIPKASAEWLARQLQRASLVLIDQAGHDLEKDQPEPVLAAAREFLNLSR